MKPLVLTILLVGCARSASPAEPVTNDDVTEADAASPEVRVRAYCAPGERPLFFVGSPEECAVTRFDCPPTTHYVEDEACGCGCAPD